MQEKNNKKDSFGERASGAILKGLGSLLALIIAFGVVGALNRGKKPAKAATAVSFPDKVVIEGLPRLAKQINEGLPMMVDEQTRADSVVAGPKKKLTYNMTFVSMKPSDISADQLRELLEPKLRKEICTSDKVSGLRSDGVVWGYKYHDNQGNVIAEIVIYPDDCKS